MGLDYKNIPINRVKRRVKNLTTSEIYNFDVDTSKYSEDQAFNLQLLYECYRHWESLSDLRRRYSMASDYNRGRQLKKVIKDNKGKSKTQEQVVREQGKTPVVINVIRDTVKTIIGQYDQNPSRSTVYAYSEDDQTASEMFTLALRSSLDRNKFKDLDAQQVEVFILGGCICSRITNKFFDDVLMKDVYIENLNLNMMFFNGDIKDVRLYDLRIIGEIIETTPQEIIHTYAKTAKQAMELEQILKPVSKQYIGNTQGLSEEVYKSDFFTPAEPSNVRIYPVWRKMSEFRILKKDPLDGSRKILKGDWKQILQEISNENQERKNFYLQQGFTEEQATTTLIQADTINYNYWEYRILTQNGYCIKKGESPYEHKSHPYILTLYPLINGEVWGLIEDLIPIQDVINQNFMMFKWMVEASAKGLLLVPEEAIPEGMDINDFAEEWSKVGGVIKIKLKPGSQLPTEVNSVSNQNAKELLSFALSMMDKVSGVHGALRGEEPKSNTPSSLYLQMAQNSATSILPILRRFESYVKDRDTKVLKNIIQIYEPGRYIDEFGEGVIEDARRWNPKMAKDIPFKLIVSSGVDTPVYRLMMEEQLQKLFFEANVIDAKTYLKKSTHPFMKEVLAEVEKQEQDAIEKQSQTQGI